MVQDARLIMKYKKLFHLLFFLSFAFQAIAGNRLDSLRKVIASTPADTLHIEALRVLAYDYLTHGQYELVLRTSEELRILSRQFSSSRAIGESWVLAGMAYLRTSQYDSALLQFSRAVPHYQSLSSHSPLASAYLYFGQTYDYKSNYKEALRKYELAERYCPSTDRLLHARVLNSRGVTYMNLGHYSTALENYQAAARIFSEESVSTYYAGTLNNIGVVYQQLSQHGEAQKYFQLFLKAAEHLDDAYFITVALLNVGENLKLTGHKNAALTYFYRALKMQRERKDYRGQSLSYLNLGDVYRAKGKLNLAEQCYRQALLFAEITMNKDLMMKPLLGLAGLSIATRTFDQAEEHLNQAHELTRISDTKTSLEAIYLNRSKLDSARGAFKPAYLWHQRYVAFKDSLLNEKNSRQIIQLQELYENEKKDKEIMRLNEVRSISELQRISDKRLFLVLILFSVAAILALAFWLIMKARLSTHLRTERNKVTEANHELTMLVEEIERQKEVLHEKNLTLEELHREKDGLIGVVAHDLMSPLNRIKGLSGLLPLMGSVTGEQHQVIEQITHSCEGGTRLIRDLLDIHQFESAGELSLVRFDLCDFVKNLATHYAVLLNGKSLVLQVRCLPEEGIELISDRSRLIRIFDNLITNAIKFSPPHRNIYMTVQANQDKEEVHVELRDEGPGFSDKDLPFLFKKFKKLSARPTGGESSTGLGLSIVKTLLDQLGGTIEVLKVPGSGAVFHLSLPVSLEQKVVESNEPLLI